MSHIRTHSDGPDKQFSLNPPAYEKTMPSYDKMCVSVYVNPTAAPVTLVDATPAAGARTQHLSADVQRSGTEITEAKPQPQHSSHSRSPHKSTPVPSDFHRLFSRTAPSSGAAALPTARPTGVGTGQGTHAVAAAPTQRPHRNTASPPRVFTSKSSAAWETYTTTLNMPVNQTKKTSLASRFSPFKLFKPKRSGQSLTSPTISPESRSDSAAYTTHAEVDSENENSAHSLPTLDSHKNPQKSKPTKHWYKRSRNTQEDAVGTLQTGRETSTTSRVSTCSQVHVSVTWSSVSL